MTTVTDADRDAVAAFHKASFDCLFNTTGAEIDAGINRAHDLLVQAFAAHREAAFEAGAKAMSAKDVAAICCAWLDADDATHWGAFEKALDAVVRPLDPAQIAGGGE